jgi:hypothetical protein
MSYSIAIFVARADLWEEQREPYAIIALVAVIEKFSGYPSSDAPASHPGDDKKFDAVVVVADHPNPGTVGQFSNDAIIIVPDVEVTASGNDLARPKQASVSGQFIGGRGDVFVYVKAVSSRYDGGSHKARGHQNKQYQNRNDP